MKRLLLLGALSAILGAPAASADVLVSESFAYPAGGLLSQGAWVSNGSVGSNSINVADGSLTRAGYQDEAAGASARLSTDMGKTSYQIIFAPKGQDAIAGAVYYSALVRVDEFPASLGSKPGAVVVLTGSNSQLALGDGITSSEGAGLYIKKGTADGTAVFGVSRKGNANGTPAADVTWCDKEIPVGQTALVVVSYAAVDGDANDPVALWVNPADASAVADVEQGPGSTVDESIVDIRGIALCQRSAITSKIPAVTVDELRVATSLQELFEGAVPPAPLPNITFSANPLDFGQIYCNVSVTRTVNVRATDLTGDITVAPGESGQVALSATTISKEAPMSEAGYDLTVTLTPVESRFFYDLITFSSEGAADKVLRAEWRPVPSTVATTLSQFCDEDNNDMTSVYVYKGQATVTFIESYYDLSYDRIVHSIFAQDATGGVELRSAMGCGYDEIDPSGVKVGDNLTDIVGQLIFGDAGLTMVPRTSAEWRVVSSGNEVKPIELTLRQLAMAQDGYVYGNQLVRVKNVVFPDEYYEAGDYHGLWNSQKYKIFDGTLDDLDGAAWMWCNKAADYYKTSTAGYFDHKWTLTGILNSYYPLHISPRGKADFEDQGHKYAGIEDVATGGEPVELDAYDLYGRRAAGKGLRVVRMSDGSVRKTFTR